MAQEALSLPFVATASDEDSDPNSPWGVRGIPIAVRHRIKVAAAKNKVSAGELLAPALEWLLDNGWLSEPPVTTGD